METRTASIPTPASETGQVVKIQGQAIVHFADGVTETANPGNPLHEVHLVGIETAVHSLG
jgi:hypothetical protein